MFVFGLPSVIPGPDRGSSVFAFVFVPPSVILDITNRASSVVAFVLPCVSFVQAKDPGSRIGVGDDRRGGIVNVHSFVDRIPGLI